MEDLDGCAIARRKKAGGTERRIKEEENCNGNSRSPCCLKRTKHACRGSEWKINEMVDH